MRNNCRHLALALWLSLVAFVEAGCAAFETPPGPTAATRSPAVAETPASTSSAPVEHPTVDPSVVPANPFDARMAAELDRYLADNMEMASIPGAAVTIVQDGRVVYEKGFGVRASGGSEPVTPDTLMMIGSTGKSMTTMMMASVVDDGLMAWNTAAVDILPSFAVSDEELTARITVRDLVCNCTGVERRDLELLFPNHPATATDLISSLRTLSFAPGQFGRTFQYSNQMVAAGGYLAALAADPATSDLLAAYASEMQERVFAPIGMTSTTFSFEDVEAANDRATPHAPRADLSLVPLPLAVEALLTPAAPAGGSWSNARDVGRYLLAQLARGVAPDGTRVVSTENLGETWTPQVDIQPGAEYALGWVVVTTRGLRLLTHGGGTAGFTSELDVLPDADLGFGILTNAHSPDVFPAAVRDRILELVFDLPPVAEAQHAERRAQVEQSARSLGGSLAPEFDATQFAPYLGTYTNPALGSATVRFEGNRLTFESGVIASELRPAKDGSFAFWDPPLVGLSLTFAGAGGTAAELVLSSAELPEPYTFTRVR